MEVLALADDLTGALETGAKFAAAGISAAVRLPGGEAPDAPVVVVDTETRHASPEDAAAVVFEHARAALAAGARMVYKKTDSTLRGNIGAELGALARAGGAEVVYAPAYPRMGRTVRGGCLYVDGVPVSQTAFARDARSPVRESSVARVLAAQTDAPVRVWDGETDADVAAAARAAVPSRVAAGPAAMAEALASLLPLPRGAPPVWPAVRCAVAVNGSLHPASRAQVEHALAHGWSRDGAWRVLEAWEGPAVRRALEELRPEALIIFGGDTAFGILDTLGRPALWPLGEILPGVPLSRAGELFVVSKAGGFGPPGVLARIREIIEART